MKREDISVEVTNIFREIFDDDMLHLMDETSQEDIDDWDSLEQVRIMLEFEKKFNIKFSIDEVLSVKTVGQIISLIERKVK